jgi:hypothetical protein
MASLLIWRHHFYFDVVVRISRWDLALTSIAGRYASGVTRYSWRVGSKLLPEILKISEGGNHTVQGQLDCGKKGPSLTDLGIYHSLPSCPHGPTLAWRETSQGGVPSFALKSSVILPKVQILGADTGRHWCLLATTITP